MMIKFDSCSDRVSSLFNQVDPSYLPNNPRKHNPITILNLFIWTHGYRYTYLQNTYRVYKYSFIMCTDLRFVYTNLVKKGHGKARASMNSLPASNIRLGKNIRSPCRIYLISVFLSAFFSCLSV